MEISIIHPDIVYNALSSKPGRSERRIALQHIHEICARRYKNGITDFSVSAVGKECESEGILKARALYNASSSDYKALIDTWSVYGARNMEGPGAEKGKGKDEFGTRKSRNRLLARIADVTIRTDVQVLVDERDRLKIELHLARAEKNLLALKVAENALSERAPAKLPRGRPLKNISEWTLTPGDLAALKNSISTEFIRRQGWSLGPQGEIRSARGETLYEPGYLQGIRKLLANLKGAG